LRVGDEVKVTPPEESTDAGIEAEDGELDILFEDQDLVVLSKPAGLAVHPGAGRNSGTLAHRLLGRYPEMASIGGRARPGIVHRLDQGTTGVMVVARSEKAYRRLCGAFASREVEKTYMAIIYGTPRPPEGLIELPIGRHPQDRKKMTITHLGRPARTRYRTLGEAKGLAWLELDLLTGRTHQIRVHLKALRRPLVGDPVYGEARWRALPSIVRRPLRLFPRPALHARRLAFVHPGTGEKVSFEAEVPTDLAELWRQVTEMDFPTS
jgi:23S rRNA pseudouridine1911/1915/1917 synthase